MLYQKPIRGCSTPYEFLVVLNLSKINLSGIFTIESNFLPFRNFNSCLYVLLFFFN